MSRLSLGLRMLARGASEVRSMMATGYFTASQGLPPPRIWPAILPGRNTSPADSLGALADFIVPVQGAGGKIIALSLKQATLFAGFDHHGWQALGGRRGGCPSMPGKSP